MERLRRPSLATALAALATVVALASVLHSGGHVWRHLTDLHRVYGSYSDKEREHAPIDALGLSSDIFDYYREYLVPGDRVYFQVKEGGLGTFIDYPTAFRYVGRFYFLPALQATDLKDATVVVTYFEDPAQLHVRYVTQRQAGVQPIYVSRIRSP